VIINSRTGTVLGRFDYLDAHLVDKSKFEEILSFANVTKQWAKEKEDVGNQMCSREERSPVVSKEGRSNALTQTS
jgi:hypothetical protein